MHGPASSGGNSFSIVWVMNMDNVVGVDDVASALNSFVDDMGISLVWSDVLDWILDWIWCAMSEDSSPPCSIVISWIGIIVED